MNEFDDLTDLDDVFGLLRSIARSAELSQESATIDLMVKAHRTSEGKHMFTSRRARIATLVATGVLGFGGMAAASPSMGGDKPADVPVVEETEDLTVVDEVEEPTIEEVETPVEVEPVEPAEEESEPALDEESEPADNEPAVEEAGPLVDDPATEFFDESTCLEGNHGKTVSAVAHDEFPEDVSVSDAAHSSCGKDDEVDETQVDDEVDDETQVDDESESEVDDEVDVDDEVESEPKAERPSRGDKAAEKSANNGNGNGKGKQDD